MWAVLLKFFIRNTPRLPKIIEITYNLKKIMLFRTSLHKHKSITKSPFIVPNYHCTYWCKYGADLMPILVEYKHWFILSEGVRKLRHLFLFNDVLVCAKYKATSRGERFTFMLKWYIPLSEVRFNRYVSIIYIFIPIFGWLLAAIMCTEQNW